MGNKQEASQRVRYIRALERFSHGVITYLSKAEEITKEGYAKKIQNSLKLLQRVPKVVLYKGELQDLEKLVTKMLHYGTQENEKDIEEIKKELTYEANQLEKSKNFKKYKKPKHNNTLDGWE
jgi:uncharacterized membrane protein